MVISLRCAALRIGSASEIAHRIKSAVRAPRVCPGLGSRVGRGHQRESNMIVVVPKTITSIVNIQSGQPETLESEHLFIVITTFRNEFLFRTIAALYSLTN
jgi:hypothetical protein